MDDPQNTRPLADDPKFLASLEDLDRGLVAEPPAEPKRTSPRPTPAAPRPPRSDLRRVTPAPAPAGPPAAVVPSSPASETAAPVGRRPLLDLFPPTPEREIAARAAHAPTAPPRHAPPRAPRPAAPRPAQVAPPRLASGTLGRSALDLLGDLPAPAASRPPVPETLTYETFYGLTEKPFSLSSDPRFLYRSGSHDRAAQEMLSAIRRREGVVVLTGEIGTGKTTLCRAVVDELDRRTLTSFVADPFLSVEELLRTVLVDFGVLSREELARDRLGGASREELAGSLRGFLGSLASLDAFAVVIVDEAQELSNDVLDQLRVLSDAEHGQRLLQVVLVGRPSLLSRLAHADLAGLAQRVAVRCRVDPIAADEIAGYVSCRLHVAGASARVEFDEDALARIHALTGGVPRLVNLVCDRALTLGYDAAASAIDAGLVERAAEDLDLEPVESRPSATARVVVAALVLAAFMLAGAAGGAYVFRDRIARAMIGWQHAPPAPRAPAVDEAPPIAPAALPRPE